MSEVAPTAPGSDGGAPAAPAPAAPAPAPAPAAPSAPPAPGTDPVAPSQPNTPVAQLTPQQQADKADEDDWDAAHKQIFPGLKKPKGASDEQAKPGEKSKEAPAGKKPGEKAEPGEEQPGSEAGAQAPKDGTENGAEDEAGNKTKPADDGRATAQARATAREIAQQRQSMVADVRAKMFKDVPSVMHDADGDPINGPEDVVGKLIDPRTGELFTEEAGYAWFLEANRQFKEQMAQVEEAIGQVADVNLQIKDEADIINAEFGEWLKAHPEIRDELWAEFESTLQKDPASEIIIRMPMSLEKYYRRALAPLVNNEAATQQKAAEAAQKQAEKEAEEQAEAEKKRSQARADRSDIYQPPSDPKAKDPDEDDWDQAHKSVFPGYQPKK